jgi:hypothetical protein
MTDLAARRLTGEAPVSGHEPTEHDQPPMTGSTGVVEAGEAFKDAVAVRRRDAGVSSSTSRNSLAAER